MTTHRNVIVAGALSTALVLAPIGAGVAASAAPVGVTPQEVSLSWLPDLLVGQFASVQATATSGLPVGIATSGACRVAAPSVLVATGAGTCTVVASQPGNAQYAAASPVTGTFEFRAAPVTVEVRPTGVGEVVPGKALESRVTVAGIAGDVPAPSGAVDAAIRDDQGTVFARVGALLDKAGHAWLRVPPAITARLALGAYRLSVSYPGDASHLASPGREERFRVVRKARASKTPSAIELGKPLVNKSSHTYRIAATSPGRVTFQAWADSHRPVQASFDGRCTGAVSATGQVTVAFTGWGDCRATLWADGNAGFAATPKRVVTLRAEKAKTRAAARTPMQVSAAVAADGSQAAGTTVTLDAMPTVDPAQAPSVQVMDGDTVAVSVPGLDVDDTWNASVADGESVDGANWSEIGEASAVAGGGVILPPITANGVGRFLVRLDPDADGADPVYFVIEVDAAPIVGDEPPIGESLDTGDDPVWKSLFKWTLEGVASDIRGQIVGWAIGKIFGAEENKQEKQMQEILQKLDYLSAQMNEMKSQIDRVNADVKLVGCKADVNAARMGVVNITTALTKYQSLIENKTTDPQNWEEWAVKTTDQGASAYWALAQIEESLKDATDVGTGAITSCSQYLYMDWSNQAAGGRVLGEAQYYGRLWDIVQYFYQYQVIGLNMVVEAEHVRAVLAYKANHPKDKLPKPEDMGRICQKSGPGEQDEYGFDPSAYCKEAKDTAQRVWNAMLNQALLAGAGFWQNPAARRSIQAQFGTTKVWVSNLRNFGSMNCPAGDSDAQDACGDAVGLDEPFSDGAASSLGYSGWQFANTKQLADILQTKKFKDKRGHEVLAAAGFDPDQGGYIVYTGDLASGGSMYWPIYSATEGWQPLEPEVWKGRCLFDTTMRIFNTDHPMPICDGDYVHMNTLAQTYKPTNWGIYFQSSSFTRGNDSANQKFYETNIVRPVYPPQRFKMGIPPAGWMVGPDHPGTEQQRWPVLDVGDPKVYGCSAFNFGINRHIDLPARNKAGALQMCGRDMETFLHQMLPDPPA